MRSPLRRTLRCPSTSSFLRRPTHDKAPRQPKASSSVFVVAVEAAVEAAIADATGECCASPAAAIAFVLATAPGLSRGDARDARRARGGERTGRKRARRSAFVAAAKLPFVACAGTHGAVIRLEHPRRRAVGAALLTRLASVGRRRARATNARRAALAIGAPARLAAGAAFAPSAAAAAFARPSRAGRRGRRRLGLGRPRRRVEIVDAQHAPTTDELPNGGCEQGRAKATRGAAVEAQRARGQS